MTNLGGESVAPPPVNHAHYAYFYGKAKIVDGDTYDLMVDLDFRTFELVRIRLHNIDVYEHNTEKGKDATLYAFDLLRNAHSIVLQSYKDEHSFERWVCDIWVDGNSLADLMRIGGYEKPT